MIKEPKRKTFPIPRATIVSAVAVAALCGAFWLAELFGGVKGTLLATQAGASTAPAAAPQAEHATDAATETAAVATNDATSAGPLFQDNPLITLSTSLREKQAELDRREADLAAREKTLVALQAELDETLKKTQAIRDEMDRLAGEAEKKRKAELDKWIGIQATMKAPEAAQLIAQMDDDFALEVLGSMEIKKSSKILGELVKTHKPRATALAKRLEAKNAR